MFLPKPWGKCLSSQATQSCRLLLRQDGFLEKENGSPKIQKYINFNLRCLLEFTWIITLFTLFSVTLLMIFFEIFLTICWCCPNVLCRPRNLCLQPLCTSLPIWNAFDCTSWCCFKYIWDYLYHVTSRQDENALDMSLDTAGKTPVEVCDDDSPRHLGHTICFVDCIGFTSLHNLVVWCRHSPLFRSKGVAECRICQNCFDHACHIDMEYVTLGQQSASLSGFVVRFLVLFLCFPYRTIFFDRLVDRWYFNDVPHFWKPIKVMVWRQRKVFSARRNGTKISFATCMVNECKNKDGRCCVSKVNCKFVTLFWLIA